MQAKVKANVATQPLVVTANRLRDGRVVWLAADRRWSTRVADAEVFWGAAAEPALAAAAEAERHQLIVGPYAAEVTLDNAGPVPLRARERFRATGPSTAPGGPAS